MNKHETTIHARCPYAPVWDYYTLTIETHEFLQCEKLQEICDEVRGKDMTQEAVFEFVSHKLPVPGKLTIVGQHGTNGRLVISESLPSIHRCK
jgi:hypothetical protein